MTSVRSRTSEASDIVGEVLGEFKVFCSLTPASFAAKVEHFSRSERSETAGIFVDVLRATTTLTVIGARGVRGIHLAVKPRTGGYDFTPPVFPEAKWLFDGEENGRPIASGMIGNSPAAAAQGQFDGRFLKFFSTNGARALEALIKAELGGVYLMSMANVGATMARIGAVGFKKVCFVGGGFYGSVTLEDTVCCGRAVGWLVEQGTHCLEDLDDESRIACQAAANYEGNDERLVADLRQSQVAKLLHAVGRGEDVSMSVDGRGLCSSLWTRMRAIIMGVTVVDTTHLLVPEHVASGVRS